jgi:hypothetical protein
LLLVLLSTASALAALPPTQDPNDAVFTATHIVIVSSENPPTFTVERVYRGNLAVGAKIDLPTFQLFTWGELRDKRPHPFTENTRILLFLRPDAKNPAAFEIADYGNAYFFRNVVDIEQLESLAKSARAFHNKWKEARDLSDPDDRVRAMFPYLLHSARNCKRLTLEELVKLNPQSGDYLASVLPTYSLGDCQSLLLDIRQLQSPKAHAAAITAINHARVRFNIYLANHDLKSLDAIAHWNDADAGVKAEYGIIYYGLAAVNSFQDPADTPYIRGLVPFLLANDFGQSIEECVHAMKDHPSPENVSVLISIWEDYKAHHYPPNNEPLLPMSLSHALAVQNDFAVIPSLLEILEIPKWHDSALGALRLARISHRAERF